ncbi:MAG: hypothetical protein K8T91_24105 [Planctomycetes bacterium]|nr:hypothetical protein [Planctomycetota bacterium]
MEQINVSDAQRDFVSLVNRVHHDGISVDLLRDKKIVARLSPVRPPATLKLGDLPAFLAQLPKLGEDSASFSKDVQAIRREFPPEVDSWDG